MTTENIETSVKKPQNKSTLAVLVSGGVLILLAVILHISILHSLIFSSDSLQDSRVMDLSSSIKGKGSGSYRFAEDEDLEEAAPGERVPMPIGYPSNLTCGALNTARYAYLNNNTFPNEPSVKFLFALDLDDAIHVVHTLFIAISKAMLHLGPQRCALSIVGNPSKDGTWHYLEELVVYMESIGVRCFLKKSILNSRESTTTRIEKLAQLRNEALEPLYNLTERGLANSSTIIIFSNDISLCVNDVLELVHQHIYQKSDMMCALDWNEDAIFYDTWISRTLTGHLFLDVEKDLWWKEGKIFFRDPIAKRSLERKKPFQVFSCWNGILTLSAEPFLKDNIRFRGPTKAECQGGEPFHLSIDFWYHGYYKVGVVPTVNVAYTDFDTNQARAKHGTADKLKMELSPIVWNSKPPVKLSCPDIHHGWTLQYSEWEDPLNVKIRIVKGFDNFLFYIQSCLSFCLSLVEKLLIVVFAVLCFKIKKESPKS